MIKEKARQDDEEEDAILETESNREREGRRESARGRKAALEARERSCRGWGPEALLTIKKRSEGKRARA